MTTKQRRLHTLPVFTIQLRLPTSQQFSGRPRIITWSGQSVPPRWSLEIWNSCVEISALTSIRKLAPTWSVATSLSVYGKLISGDCVFFIFAIGCLLCSDRGKSSPSVNNVMGGEWWPKFDRLRNYRVYLCFVVYGNSLPIDMWWLPFDLVSYGMEVTSSQPAK